MFKTKTVFARQLQAGNRFKMAGAMFRIDDVHPNDYDQRVIHAYDLFSLDPITLIVKKNAQFKIYILKK